MFVTRTISACIILTAAISPLAASGFAGPASRFTVSEPTNVPGLTLRPGSYSIHVVDHLSERFVVRVDSGRGRTHSTFLALADPSIPIPTAPGRLVWKNGPDGKEYLRGWFFPGVSSVLEFVYPKAEAVSIAKSNQAKVPAIDPASEGRPPTIKGLSRNDLELVTLWLLSSTQVGPGDSAGGGIQAERFRQVSTARQKPVVSRLPQTGSYLPWIGLLGALSFLSALGLRVSRTSSLFRAG